jgi:hypothetical protein
MLERPRFKFSAALFESSYQSGDRCLDDKTSKGLSAFRFPLGLSKNDIAAEQETGVILALDASTSSYTILTLSKESQYKYEHFPLSTLQTDNLLKFSTANRLQKSTAVNDDELTFAAIIRAIFGRICRIALKHRYM